MKGKQMEISVRTAVIHVKKTSEELIWTALEGIADSVSLDLYNLNTDKIVEQNRIKLYPINAWLCTDAMAGYYAIYFDDKPAAFCWREGRKFDWKISYLSKEIAMEVHKYLSSFLFVQGPEFRVLDETDHMSVYPFDGRISIALSDNEITEAGLAVNVESVGVKAMREITLVSKSSAVLTVDEEKNRKIINDTFDRLDLIPGIRLGDFIRLGDGNIVRVTHVWDDDDSVQTFEDGSYHVDDGISFSSGSLYPGIPAKSCIRTNETRLGLIWVFNRGWQEAHMGVHYRVPFRVYECADYVKGKWGLVKK
jgi:hypothetical protein